MLGAHTRMLSDTQAKCSQGLLELNGSIIYIRSAAAWVPQILKGFLDRILLPGFAFRVDGNAPTGYTPMLSGRSAQVLTTMDSPSWVYRWIYGRPGDRAMKGGILGFAGLFLVEMASVFLNEYHDRATDERNENAGPFTGGSRMLVTGRLCPESLRRAARRALAASVLVLGVFLGLRFWQGADTGSLLAIGAFVGLGYLLGPGLHRAALEAGLPGLG